MCQLNQKYDKEEFIGWKVVAVKNKEYYSIAMGFQYPKSGNVPFVTKQKRLNSHFVNYILERPDSDEIFSPTPYRPDMDGRTAAFVHVEDAVSLRVDICAWGLPTDEKNEFHYAVVKVKLTQDLLQGFYNDRQVVAGRHIEILEESVNKKG